MMDAHLYQNGLEGVVVRRSGHDPIASRPAEGATLADLLRSLDIAPEEHAILVDGRSLAEAFAPPPGSVVTVIRKVDGETLCPQPDLTIGRFANDPLFEQMMDEVRAAREAERGGS